LLAAGGWFFERLDVVFLLERKSGDAGDDGGSVTSDAGKLPHF
jgi:hypothetical protein